MLIPRSPRTSPGGASPAAQEPAPSRSWPTGSPRRVVDERCDERFLTHSARTAGPGGPTLPFPAAFPGFRETLRRAVPVDVPQVPVLWAGPFGRRLPAAEQVCRSEGLPVGVNRPVGGTRETLAKGDRSHHQRSVSVFTGGRNRSCVRTRRLRVVRGVTRVLGSVRLELSRRLSSIPEDPPRQSSSPNPTVCGLRKSSLLRGFAP